ncbi:hypothetical protein QMK33_10875 [Hymenobacter sp. H14-R3]|uniref:hypothetical protein n=1 Tax=Hymenobacter sp. H14-R3 TaxID=3046308 RepID=UPI0024BBA483|nr:hypothetical protein [Hymenobacter sp. H14-R3]MDJ0365656.1 hypothetical protein [Hymenobacter sp. H14-R3]
MSWPTTTFQVLPTQLVAPPAGADLLTQKLYQVFAHLDISQVPTGRLLEYGVLMAPVQGFDGTLRDSARADMDVFRHLFVSVQSSRIAGSDNLPDLLTFNQRVLAATPTTPDGTIPIAVQYLGYAHLRPDAETAGLVTIQNEQLYDVAGRQQSPYQTAVLFAAAPARTYSATPTVSLVLPSNLYLASGTPTAAPLLLLDFGDGQGYHQAAWDQPLSTTYATAGTKRIKVALTYRSTVDPDYNEVRESWFDLTILPGSTTAAAKTTSGQSGSTTNLYNPDTPPGSPEGFDWPIASTVNVPAPTDYTHHRGGTVNVRYGKTNGQLHTAVVKPFIVVEGYDTSLIAPNLVGMNNQNNDIASFIRGIDRAAPFNFNDALQNVGYDLVYIDFRDGADDIRRNALLFEIVLRQVNDWKQQAGSVEPNVVMGESMGGLIARYGLAQLVRAGYDPQTRLLVLHDSPQRGANNPMGLQALTRQADFPLAILPGNNQGGAKGIVYTSDMSVKLKDALAILAAPATKQLSLKSVTGIDNEYENNTFIDGPYKDMIDFGGTPPAIFPPIIATSVGSQCGRPQNTPVYQELTRNDRAYLLGSNNNFADIGFRTEAIANGLPAYGTQNTIAHLRVSFEIRVLWLRIAVNLLNRNYTSPSNTLPYETLAGGYTNLYEQRDLLENSDFNIGILQAADITNVYNGNLCFVPTYSALDVLTVTPATAYAKYINNTTDNPSPPRIPSYIANQNTTGSDFNQPHIRFTARNSEWIYNEMQRPFNGNTNSLPCATECSIALTITGPTQVCTSPTSVFSVNYDARCDVERYTQQFLHDHHRLG